MFACVHAAPPSASHMQMTGGRSSPFFPPVALTGAGQDVARGGVGEGERTAGPGAHHLADGLGLLGELGGVHLLRLQDPAVHLLPLHLLLAAPERRLALDHLIDEAAQAPVVGAQAVPLVVQDLGSWRGGSEQRGERPPGAAQSPGARRGLRLMPAGPAPSSLTGSRFQAPDVALGLFPAAPGGMAGSRLRGQGRAPAALCLESCLAPSRRSALCPAPPNGLPPVTGLPKGCPPAAGPPRQRGLLLSMAECQPGHWPRSGLALDAGGLQVGGAESWVQSHHPLGLHPPGLRPPTSHHQKRPCF